MITLRDTEVDGVRCFWVDTGRPTLYARLMFRAGMVDEEFHESGWLHLLEHLCLHGRPSLGALQVNGSVSLLVTAFDSHGPADAVADHLGQVAAYLRNPQFDELDHERKVLRAEADTRDSVAARALSWRYGARGPALASYPEPGLIRAVPELLRNLAARVFTRGNAVLMLDGPPPEGLTLELPDGELLAPPPAVSNVATQPALYVDRGLVMSGVVARSEEATMLPDLLQLALKRRLRDEAAAAYAPWGA